MATSINISLPESLKEFVRKRTMEGDFSSPSEYIRSLIRQDKERLGGRRLEDQLLEGLSSGPPRQVGDAYWAEKRRGLEPAK